MCAHCLYSMGALVTRLAMIRSTLFGSAVLEGATSLRLASMSQSTSPAPSDEADPGMHAAAALTVERALPSSQLLCGFASGPSA